MLNSILLASVIVFVLIILGILVTICVNIFLIPLFKTPNKVLEEIISAMNLTKEDIFVDLGSGDGRLVLKAYQEAKCKCYGYDIAPLMLLLSKLKASLLFPFSKDIVLEAEDIFQIDFSKATKVYCYLDEKGMKILSPKLKTYIGNGGKVYSYRYPMIDTKGKELILSDEKILYIYE